jgi:hypothetical protein
MTRHETQHVPISRDSAPSATTENWHGTTTALETRLSTLPRDAQIAHRQRINEEIQRIELYELREARAKFLLENPVPQEQPEVRHQHFLRIDSLYRELAAKLEARGSELFKKEVADYINYHPKFRVRTASIRHQLAAYLEERDALDALIDPGPSTDPTPIVPEPSSSFHRLTRASQEAPEASLQEPARLPRRKRRAWAATLVASLIVGGLGLGLVALGSHPAGTSEHFPNVLVHVTEPDVDVSIGEHTYHVEGRAADPISLNLAVGRHQLIMRRGDRVLCDQTFEIRPGEETMLTAWDSEKDLRRDQRNK